MSAHPSPPRSPSPVQSDSDSDLDLDLEELDPSTASYQPAGNSGYRPVGGDHRAFSTTPSSGAGGSKRTRDSSPRIALKSLMGIARRKYERLKATDDDDSDREEDRQGLLRVGQPSSSRGARTRSGGEGSQGQEESALLHPTVRGLSRSPSKTSLRSSRQSSPPPPGGKTSDSTRILPLAPGSIKSSQFPPNIVSNHKFTPITFLPLTLYHEFSYFFNLYFLLVALSQIIPVLRIGFLSSYIVPLAFVLCVTLGKEALDDLARRRRDAEANGEGYEVLASDNVASESDGRVSRRKLKNRNQARTTAQEEYPVEGQGAVRTVTKKAKDIKVGDLLVLHKDQRVPADVIILKSIPTDPSDDVTGEAFIRTDQLDGETDWKLRIAPSLTQSLPPTLDAFSDLTITASPPSKAVDSFFGKITFTPQDSNAQSSSQALTIDNTAWANTVIASTTTTIAAVIFTGPETRQSLSTSKARSKTGLLEEEINNLTKILCFITFTLSIALVALRGIEPHTPDSDGTNDDVINTPWYVKIMRFLILFSSIIPISLRVNLDMGKSVYARFIERDEGIQGTVVRTSTIPEELGRVEYLLSDKTGTLTQNDMELKKIHVGTVSYAGEAMDEVVEYVRQGFPGAARTDSSDPSLPSILVTQATGSTQQSSGAGRARREIGSRVRDVVLALSLCHNVTPTTTPSLEDPTIIETSYQASSPDEIAIVRWTESVGLRLVHRDRKSIALQSVATGEVVVRVKILEVFPFTSEGKRMGIVIQFQSAEKQEPDLLASASEEVDISKGDIWFFQKGADTVMSTIVGANDWLDEECGNMAREGLRTLVVGRKRLSVEKYREFAERYKSASLLLQNRDKEMHKVVDEYLERDLELLGVTGVEDKLQRDVKPSLELLRNAGIKIWMLTGDKVETARCVAVSAKLVARGQYIHTVAKLKRKDAAYDTLEFLRNKTDSCLLIDGESLALFLDSYRDDFISLAVRLPAVVACRCTPTQKADIARLIRTFTKKRICCIGDGGNDVSMIQAADVGVGIVGKEGRQASLAADFSITQFAHLTKLLVWHGRNSYKRSAKLAQFVIHRGLIISVCQTMFSIASKFEPIALYQGWLLVGYATLYTMAPVFSLVLDKDVDEHLANLYPELYKELTEGRSLSYKTFGIWVLVSVYQGGVIQGLSQILVGLDRFKEMVAVSFTVLVLNELVMVALEITTWHFYMILTLAATALLFVASMPLLGDYFDLKYVLTVGYLWRVLAIMSVSIIPPWVIKMVSRRWRPPSWDKVRGV